jgi:His-Xaa-Ser system radical SAM maturase HxsB
MSEILPLRIRRLNADTFVFADEAGRFFMAGDDLAQRLVDGQLSQTDRDYLSRRGMVTECGDVNETAFLHTLARRLEPPSGLAYVILVPTLRCDLSCAYCQVSRAAKNAIGYDWDEVTLDATIAYLDRNGGKTIQIEFQGGEPSLRMDLIERVAAFARQRFEKPRFVICTNLSNLDDDLRGFIENEDVSVSTSLDGPFWLHQKQRTVTEDTTNNFLKNLREACRLAPGRVHALPTLDVDALPSPSELLDAFDEYGLRSIYLRPVTYHGFARKRHPSSVAYDPRWAAFYEEVISEIIIRNRGIAGAAWEEFYLSHLLKRLLRPGENSHADLRSPNWLAYDHQVIDFDGQIYPTDEARMLARSRLIDLSVGDVKAGIDEERRLTLQGNAFNTFDPWCSRCPYQAACGVDPIDDLARHGFTGPPKPSTSFCQRHLHLFDLAMKLMHSPDVAVQDSIAKWLHLPASMELGRRFA